MGVLSEQRLWVVSGKGGVGKSTVTAALALASARQGHRTLVCEINVQERISAFLERPEVGPEIRQLDPNLFAVNVRPEEAMREYALMIVRFERVYRTVFENRLVKYFLRFIPSLQELVLLGKVLFHLQEKTADGRWKWDRIIMDAPATGHAITFLNVPQVILDTVPPGPMATQAERMRDLLTDPQTTAAILVTLPEEMPVNETVDLYRAMGRQLQIHPRAVVLNMYVGDRFGAGDLEQVPASLRDLVRDHMCREELSAKARARLEAELELPVIAVPRLFDRSIGRRTMETVAGHLSPLWEGSAS
ncbi:MAG: ArsA family ATPase [Myxococcaceae bacterium]|nr:ArsA family ATPase [Myxococcaceae bacterium]